MRATINSRLRELRGSGYEIVDGQPDIINWDIKDTAFHKVGVVEDLLFDVDDQKVRYIIANLKDNDFDLEKRKIVIPIGIAELHENNDDVIIPSLSAWQLRALPDYRTNALTDQDEQDVFSVFSTSTAAGSTSGVSRPHGEHLYQHAYYNHDNLFRRRTAQQQHEVPMSRTFRKREGSEHLPADERHEITADDLRNRRNKNTPQPVEVLANHPSGSADDRVQRDAAEGNERLISKIKRMQSELNDIERELRNNPGNLR